MADRKIPRYAQEGKLPPYGGAAQVSDQDIYNMTAPGREKVRAAGALSDIAQKFLAVSLARKNELRDRDIRSQALSGKNYWQQKENEFLLSLDKDETPDTWTKRYQQAMQQAAEDAIRNTRYPEAQEALRPWFEAQQIQGEYIITVKGRDRSLDLQKRQFSDVFSRLLEQPDWENEQQPLHEAREHLEEAAEAGWLTDSEYNQGLEQYRQALESAAFNMANSMGLEEGERWLSQRGNKNQFVNVPELSPDDRKSVINNLRYFQEKEEKRAKSLEEIYTEQSHKDTVARLAEDPYDMTFINDVPEVIKSFWQKQMGRDFNTFDPALYSGLKQQIREDPKSVDYMDIVRSVGNGLTPKMGQELFKLQDDMELKDNPMNQPHVKRAHDRISDLQRLGLSIGGFDTPTQDTTPAEAEAYWSKIDSLHDIIDKNAELSPEKMREFTGELLRPTIESSALDWLDTWYQETRYRLKGGMLIPKGMRKAFRSPPLNVTDFETNVIIFKNINREMAKAYYDRWAGEIK